MNACLFYFATSNNLWVHSCHHNMTMWLVSYNKFIVHVMIVSFTPCTCTLSRLFFAYFWIFLQVFWLPEEPFQWIKGRNFSNQTFIPAHLLWNQHTEWDMPVGLVWITIIFPSPSQRLHHGYIVSVQIITTYEHWIGFFSLPFIATIEGLDSGRLSLSYVWP